MGLFGVLTKFFKKPPAAPTELDEAVRSFQDKTGIRFNDVGLLRVALTHGSYVHEHPDTGLESMGRMELLGDSVLGLVVNEYLYSSSPASEEAAPEDEIAARQQGGAGQTRQEHAPGVLPPVG
jgi:hypothetical protein